MSQKESEIQEIVERAVEALQHHAPTGLTDRKALSEFYSIFEGHASWKALPKGAPAKERTEASHIMQKTAYRDQKPAKSSKTGRSSG